VERALGPARAWDDTARWNAQGHIGSVQTLTQHALATVSNSQADIIYLHLPAPHPLSFWDRKTSTFAAGGSYLDSLDFTDRLLGQLLDELQAQPRWAATTLIVQGDHSWRTAMWRPLPGWSSEDERISRGGAWDPRPMLMIHSPAQRDAQVVTAPTSVMHVHDAVADLIESIAGGTHQGNKGSTGAVQ
jgi:arylsulfatase A-like enzyme